MFIDDAAVSISKNAAASLGLIKSFDIMQIGFPDVPEGTKLTSGTASVTINANRQAALSLEPQAITERAITHSVAALKEL